MLLKKDETTEKKFTKYCRRKVERLLSIAGGKWKERRKQDKEKFKVRYKTFRNGTENHSLL